MNHSESRSDSKTAWIVGGVVIALVILGVSVYAVIMAMMPHPAPKNIASEKVTDEQLRQNFSTYNKTLVREKTDLIKMQQSLDDQVKRIKLTN